MAQTEIQKSAQARLPREVVVLVAAAFVVAIGYGLVAPVLPTYAASFGVSHTAVSAIISAFALARLVFAPAAGRLLRHLSERPVYLTGLIIVSISSAGIAFAPGYSGLLIARTFGGIGSTLFTISSFALLVRVTPPALRGRASAMYSTGFLVGNISGPVLGGLLAGWSIRAPFLSYAALLLVAAALVQVLLGRIPPPIRSLDAPTLALRPTLRLPAFRAAMSANFAVGWAVYGIRIALIPLFVVQVLGAAPSTAGYALTVFAIGNALVLPFVGRWVDLAGRKPAAMIGIAVSAVALGLIGVSGSIWQLMVLCFLGGIGSGLITPAQQAVVADVIGPHSGGSVLAAYQMTGDLGGVLGPLVAGALVDLYNYEIALGVAAAVVAATLAFWVRAPETLPTREQSARPGR